MTATDEQAPQRPFQILLLEPIPLVGGLWQRVLEEEPRFERITVIDEPERALEQLEAVDLVVIGPSLSPEGALEFTRQATLERPEVQVVIMGVAQTEAAVVAAAESGAAGIVLRQESVEEAMEALRAAAAGEARISSEVAPLLMARLAELKVSQPDVDTIGRRYLGLTQREREVLELIGQGLSNRQIAGRLVLEVGTVKNHVHRILEKLDKSNRQEAAGYLRSVPTEVINANTTGPDRSGA